MRNRHLRNISIVALLILLLTITASAHSGRTDSNGGHYNNSTGEYHYHHGYSAHQHYDINGDGIIDCPKEFREETNYIDTSNDNYVSTDKKTEYKAEPSIKLTFGDILVIILKIIWTILKVSIFGLIGWILVYAVLTLLISWICEKVLKKDYYTLSSTISIILIVVAVIIISSIIVLSSEGLL